jgi:hypothetical protein
VSSLSAIAVPFSWPRLTVAPARAAVRLAMVAAPLLMLLVGSCKTAELPGAYGSNAAPDQFRLALFPDQLRAAHAEDYRPARGYVARAQTYVAGAPETLELLTAREVGYLFGEPAWSRKDAVAGAHVWQYRQDDCVVDFYFYGDSAAQPAVSHADVRRRQGGGRLDGADRGQCLQSLMRG